MMIIIRNIDIIGVIKKIGGAILMNAETATEEIIEYLKELNDGNWANLLDDIIKDPIDDFHKSITQIIEKNMEDSIQNSIIDLQKRVNNIFEKEIEDVSNLLNQQYPGVDSVGIHNITYHIGNKEKFTFIIRGNEQDLNLISKDYKCISSYCGGKLDYVLINLN